MPLRNLSLLVIAFFFSEPVLAQDKILTFDQAQTAGISGFRAHWDVPIPLAEDGATQFVDTVIKDKSPTAVWSPGQRNGRPGAIAFDALNRSLLVRFPGSVQAIFDSIRQGYAITKVELVLPFRDTELWPPGDTNFAPSDGYLYRTNWGVDDLYRKLSPQWHAVAWALRRPWQSDEILGPTFNAYINGAGFWTKYGASDEQDDRFPIRFGPVEVSEKVPEGRLDLTPLLSSPIFGDTVAQRLQNLDCCGFLINKLETYDARYLMESGEWATATGGRAILLKKPKLIVRLSRSHASKYESDLGGISPTISIAVMADAFRPNGSGGHPTATLPSETDLADIVGKYVPKPSWMPPWQWNHVNELKRINRSHGIYQPFFYDLVPEFIIDRLGARPTPYHEPSLSNVFDVYGAWVDSIIGRQPRDWNGFDAASQMMQWFMYGDAIPAAARQAFRRYWTGWLMPDRNTAPLAKQLDQNLLDGTLIHPQADQLSGTWKNGMGVVNSYYAYTQDWRGNQSFYRSGYNFSISTENFNHTAAVGALLGGAVIGSIKSIADGRHGWENYPLRLWSWSRGFSQENIDHYYFAITLSDQKVVADFGPTLFDRLMSQGMLAKSLDELIAAYHPGLRRFIAGSSRTSLEYLLVKQDGLQYLLHTLSRAGTLHDVDNSEAKSLLPGMDNVIGEEAPPLRVAMQAASSAWAPEWAANLVDEKPLPYSAMASGDGIAISYLGHHYGLATATKTRRLQFLAQWQREAKSVEKMSELVTAVAGYGVNDTRFANDSWGWIAPVGAQTFLQHGNKVLMLAHPRDGVFLRQKIQREGLKSLQSSIALFNYQQPAPNWEIYVDGNRVTKLPYTTHAGAKIVIHDGVSYFGIVPIPGTDLGGGNTVVLREGTAQEWNKITFKPALVIDSYNLCRDDSAINPDWSRIDQAFGGFGLELADTNDYSSFAAFQQHLANVEVQVHFEEPSTGSVYYKSGDDILETGLATIGGELTLVRPEVNGRPAFLPPGVLRDTSTSIQGDAATIEKLGAMLQGEQGRMKFIQAEPQSGTFVGWNPLPDLMKFSFLIPNGIKIQSDGQIGLARVLVNPRENRVVVTQAWREGQDREPNAATTLVLSGFKKPPKVELNGTVQINLITCTLRGQPVYLVPLRDITSSVDEQEKTLCD
jgi:hypothetical protein